MLKGFFGRVSGLDEFAGRYSANREPAGTKLTAQNVQIGAVRYRRCVTVHVDPEGLFLQIRFVFCRSRPPFFIPWRDMKKIKDTRLYWQKAALLSVGSHDARQIIVPQPLYRLIEPHLT